jgi:hypothetical protein
MTPATSPCPYALLAPTLDRLDAGPTEDETAATTAKTMHARIRSSIPETAWLGGEMELSGFEPL